MMSLPNKHNAANKPDTISDEVLSAYFDGELPHDQIARVEQWLSKSLEARQKLEEFHRLSGLIQDLPRAELPTEFAAHILQQAERQMLLPVTFAEPRSRWRRIRWWTLSVVAPLTATAALLFVTLRFIGPAQQPAGDMAQIVRDEPISPPAQSATEPMIAANTPEAGLNSPVAADASLDDAGAAAERAAALPADPSIEVSADKAKSDAAADAEVPTQLAALFEGIRKANELRQTPVLRVYVVDRRAGMDLVQVVLDEHHIPRESATGAPFRKTDSTPVEKPILADAVPSEPTATVGHEALFVVADVKELQGALEALLAQKERALTWKLDKPIDLDRLDRRSQDLIEETLVALGQTLPGGRSPKNDEVGNGHLGRSEKAPAVVESASSAKLPANGGSSGKDSGLPASPTTAKPGTGLAAVDSPVRSGKSARRPGARQLRVTLADPVPLATVESVRVTGGESASAAKEIGPAAMRDAAAQRPSFVRVILVVEPQAPVVLPAEAEPARPNPGDGAA